MGDLKEISQAQTSAEASSAFFRIMQPFGASYLQTRVYRRPDEPLTSERHFSAGGFVLRIAPEAWPQSEAFNFICFQCNPLLDAIRQSRTLYRFEDFAPHHDRKYGRYWEALGEAKISETLCCSSYGSSGKIASLHIGFPSRQLEPNHSRAIQMVGLLLTERLMELSEPPEVDVVHLTQRELDGLRLVAEGKTDWDVSVALGISESTARFHIDNGRRKLGAISRSHAVAKLIYRGLA